MQLLQANKILLTSCAVSIPISFYVGRKLKERYLANELDRIEKGTAPHEMRLKARIMELQQERAELLRESSDLDSKISTLRNRMSSGTV